MKSVETTYEGREGVFNTYEYILFEKLRNYLVLTVTQNALERTLSSRLHGRFDFVIGGFFRQSTGQVDDRNVVNRHAEGHTCQFSVQCGDNLADGLGGTCSCGNDVLCSTTAISPQLNVDDDKFSRCKFEFTMRSILCRKDHRRSSE